MKYFTFSFSHYKILIYWLCYQSIFSTNFVIKMTYVLLIFTIGNFIDGNINKGGDKLFKITRSSFFISCFCFCFFAFFFNKEIVQGKEGNFSAQIIAIDQEKNHSETSLDLKMNPSEKKKLLIELKNNTNQETIVQAKIVTAKTNDNGNIDYSLKNMKQDHSAAITFNDLATLSDEDISLSGNEKKQIVCEIEMPSMGFDGEVLGGIYFEEEESEDRILPINTHFFQVIKVLVNETNKKVAPKLELEKVMIAQRNRRNVVLVNIQNTQPAIVENLDIKAKLYYENEQKPRYESHQSQLKMAPNTNFDYKIDLKAQPFLAGHYKVNVQAVNNNQIWHWEEKFTINKKEAQKYNSTAIKLTSDKQARIPTVVIIEVVILFFILIGALAYSLKQKYQRSKNNES